MKILYVGEMYIGSVSEQRMRVLTKMGYQLVPVDNEVGWRRLDPRRLLYKASYHAGYPADLSGVNRRLTRLCKQQRPDLVWIDKGVNIYPWTLRRVKKILPSTPIVNFNPDNPFYPGAQGWGWFKRGILIYDYCFVPRAVSISEHLDAGAKQVARFYWGFTPEVHHPVLVTCDDKEIYGGRVGFIGSYETPRYRMLRALAQVGVSVRVWGNGWNTQENDVPNLLIEGRGVWDKEFSRAICAFDINLCFLNKQNRDTLNTRCIAIPACGGFMLAERTDDLVELFKEGIEAEFFDSAEELIDKVSFYLEHGALRQKIAKAGRQRCLDGKYSNYDRLKELLNTVLNR